MKSIKLLLIVYLFLGYAKAQDLIYKKDKTILKTVLIDIGAEEIKYKDYNNQVGSILIIKKSEVIKIVTERGKEILFDQSITNSFDKRNAIKIGVFSWAVSHLSVTYERNLAPTLGFEIQLGLIADFGLAPIEVVKLGGAFTRVGFKFLRSPEYYKRKGREAHLLKGSYLRPEFVIGRYVETRNVEHLSRYGFYYDELATEKITFFACMLNVGHQWIIADDFSVDIFCGAGFGGNTGKKRDDNYAIAGPSPLFLNGGVKIGVLFK